MIEGYSQDGSRTRIKPGNSTQKEEWTSEISISKRHLSKLSWTQVPISQSSDTREAEYTITSPQERSKQQQICLVPCSIDRPGLNFQVWNSRKFSDKWQLSEPETLEWIRRSNAIKRDGCARFKPLDQYWLLLSWVFKYLLSRAHQVFTRHRIVLEHKFKCVWSAPTKFMCRICTTADCHPIVFYVIIHSPKPRYQPLQLPPTSAYRLYKLSV